MNKLQARIRKNRRRRRGVRWELFDGCFSWFRPPFAIRFPGGRKRRDWNE